MRRRAEENRAARVALAIVVAYAVAHALCTAYGLAVLWDLRAFSAAWMDQAWELELTWRARAGEWSGIDFHYLRGPLWQGIAWLGSQPWTAFDEGRTLGGITLAFRLLGLAVVGWIVGTRVPRAWPRVAAFLVLSALSFGAGVPTFRAVVSAALVFLYLPPAGRDEAPGWGRPFAVAGLCAAALLLSFERFGMAGLSLAAMVGAEGLARWRAGRRPALALDRAVRTLGAVSVAVALLALASWLLGADPLEYVLGQRRLATGYAAGMQTPWYVGVPPANVIGFFVVSVALLTAMLWARCEVRHVVWIVGSLPTAVFGMVAADEGHVFMSILPLTSVLAVIAASGEARPWLRLASGLVTAIVLLGWFGTYPSAFSLNPEAFGTAWAAATGEKEPDRGFETDHGRAVAWAREVVAREDPRCMSVWPGLSFVHAMARVPGPTVLGLRWNDELQRQLAERIERDDCPIYLHGLVSFDDIGGAWFLGPDFVEAAHRYELDERVGVAVYALRRRERPVEVDERPVTSDAVGRPQVLALPAELAIPLGRDIPGEHVLRLDYRLDVPAWRAQLGGLPWGQWRFERDGEPLGEWKPLHHLHASERSTVYLSPDPEAVEHWWIAHRRLERRRAADTLRVRFRRRGRVTPDRIGLTLLALTEIPPPDPPAEPEPGACEAEVDLLERLRRGEAFTRMASPRPSEVHFHLEPNPYPVALAEVFFPIRPCPETCLFASLGVDADADASDGATFEVHSIWREHRPMLANPHVPAGRGEVAIEVPIDRWPGDPQLIRIGTRTGPDTSNDYAFVAAPRVGSCTARTWLADGLREEQTRVERGRVTPHERDLLVAGAPARIRHPMRVIDDTCFGLGVSAEQPGRFHVQVAIRADGLDHVLHDRVSEVGPDPTGWSFGLHDWTDRRVELLVEVERLEGDAPLSIRGPHVYGCAP